ncbi:MAG: peroxide stress protein YaaA, partial [Actinomycetota bacterium]|nr:peroxide stress protein YaaA [Actinomycetota bacterium]
ALGAPRATVLDALGTLVHGDPDVAANALALPPGIAAQALAANAAVTDSPTTPALRRYTGVLYAAFGFSGLTPPAQRVAARSVLVFSGLFGVLRGDEPVPLYRVPAKAVLPGLGIAGTFWRAALRDVMPAMLGRGLVVDLRSGEYAAMWRPDARTAGRVLSVRVLSPDQRDGYAVLSYQSKLAKGHLAAALVSRAAAGQPVDTAEDVAAAWQSCGGIGGDVTARMQLDLYTP